jgi:hypothetical protein
VRQKLLGDNEYSFYSITCFQKSCRQRDNVEKYGSARQVTDDNMAHALCLLDNQGYKHPECVILIAFSMQQWLRERAAVYCYTYAACRCNSVQP